MRLLVPQVVPLEDEERFGDILRSAVRIETKQKLLERSPEVGKRLLLSQAQALSLVVASAEELAKIDSNTQRQSWLGRVARDYQQMYNVYLKMLVLTDSDS